MSKSEAPEIRIGNAERDAASTALGAHLDAGRLDLDEYAERYAKAGLARTRADLDVLFTDLPKPHAFTPPPPPRPSVAERVGVRDSYYLGQLMRFAPLIVLVLVLVTRSWFLFWIIPISAVFFGGRFGARRGRTRRRGGSW